MLTTSIRAYLLYEFKLKQHKLLETFARHLERTQLMIAQKN